MVAGDEALGLQDVLPQFVNVAGSTREVSRRLDAAAQGTGLYLEPVHVVGLPAMQTQVEVLQLLQHLLCVYISLYYVISLLRYIVITLLRYFFVMP